MSSSMTRWLSRLFGTAASASSVAGALGKQMGATPSAAESRQRLTGSWAGRRCRITLDDEADSMTVTMSSACQHRTWSIWWANGKSDGSLTHVGRHAVLSNGDAELLEALPLSTRLHVIDVIEAGRGSIRLKEGTLTLEARPAGLAQKNGADQAAIRLDVLADLAGAVGKAFLHR